MMKNTIAGLTKWCAYSHIFKVCSALLKGRGLSEQTKAGRNIALLGLFCPLFWLALLTGATKAELMFHATHSGIVFLIGIVIIFVSLRQQKEH